MKRLLFLVIAIYTINSVHAYAQCIISGNIIDQSNEQVPFAAVIIEPIGKTNGTIGLMADSDKSKFITGQTLFLFGNPLHRPHIGAFVRKS
jgi:hypothetical protein